jgi:CBS domain-containing protein
MKQRMRLANLLIKDIRHLLVVNPASVTVETPLRKLLVEMINDVRTRQVYVVDGDNRLLGVVRMGSVVEYLFPFDAIIEHDKQLLYDLYIPKKIDVKNAADIMTSPPLRVTEETTLGEMAGILMDEGINELPVVDKQERLIGQVNMYETIKAFLGIKEPLNKS